MAGKKRKAEIAWKKRIAEIDRKKKIGTTKRITEMYRKKNVAEMGRKKIIVSIRWENQKLTEEREKENERPNQHKCIGIEKHKSADKLEKP